MLQILMFIGAYCIPVYYTLCNTVRCTGNHLHCISDFTALECTSLAMQYNTELHISET